MYIFLKYVQKVVRLTVPSSTPEVRIHQSNLHSLVGQSSFSLLKENCEDVPIKVVKERSQFMDDQTDFNNSSFMVHDDQPNINLKRSMVLHPLLAVDEYTPLPIRRVSHLGLFNTSPYVTSFSLEYGTTKFTVYIVIDISALSIVLAATNVPLYGPLR
ncbi:hypothetical protein H5410_009579 [Solanum commersonii]|uniref:Uncharacterized protein n=1 Tax=Solanum commersonii TaxID=4109 RepID=A0A9J6AIT8_SOLCO|nr:hypothetical protein H5410_009579 [Solanum commersonii]